MVRTKTKSSSGLTKSALPVISSPHDQVITKESPPSNVLSTSAVNFHTADSPTSTNEGNAENSSGSEDLAKSTASFGDHGQTEVTLFAYQSSSPFAPSTNKISTDSASSACQPSPPMAPSTNQNSCDSASSACLPSSACLTSSNVNFSSQQTTSNRTPFSRLKTFDHTSPA